MERCLYRHDFGLIDEAIDFTSLEINTPSLVRDMPRMRPEFLELRAEFPMHYKDLGNISLTERRQLLEKAWSVPVVCHSLRPWRSFCYSQRTP
ncbi:hypothetical protein HPB50_004966 [Hyalomma asiaticum]|uniref:Uncharacterized protein n=1 Tax=Hyalomma asiaticum TaxID=266040 RepID=A0ACB7TB62_HYAAI|nr:hypothetical protein HPB50_004966 [Hyalomma asiaticum]